MARVRDQPVRGTHQPVRPQQVNLRRYGIVVSLPLARKILRWRAEPRVGPPSPTRCANRLGYVSAGDDHRP